MLHITTFLGESAVHGIGLFAGEDIAKDTLIYEPSPDIDLMLDQQSFEKLRTEEKAHIQHYGFFDHYTQRWTLAFDDIRFCNHSLQPNMKAFGAGKACKVIALRDIVAGEELTQNYEDFEKPLRKELQ